MIEDHEWYQFIKTDLKDQVKTLLQEIHSINIKSDQELTIVENE